MSRDQTSLSHAQRYRFLWQDIGNTVGIELLSQYDSLFSVHYVHTYVRRERDRYGLLFVLGMIIFNSSIQKLLTQLWHRGNLFFSNRKRIVSSSLLSDPVLGCSKQLFGNRLLTSSHPFLVRIYLDGLLRCVPEWENESLLRQYRNDNNNHHLKKKKKKKKKKNNTSTTGSNCETTFWLAKGKYIP